MDDVLVYGNDREEHDKRLESVMKRLREADLKLNKEKCVFAQSELKFLGHKFTKSGIEPDGDKVSAILEMPEPMSVPLVRYAQIEKECLAGVWACEKFDRFLCGLEGFKILTDQKPLVTLINEKDLDRAPLRCQRLLMRMHRYNATAEYAPGKTTVISDALSRSPWSCVETTCDKEVKVYVGMVEENLPMTDNQKEELPRATQEEDVLRAACVYTLAGWPKYEQDVPTQLCELFCVRGSLSVSNGLLTYGDRISTNKMCQLNSVSYSVLEVVCQSATAC